jgi:branched-chain amino acid transport system ATP-binding protein
MKETPLLRVRDVTAFYGDFLALAGLTFEVYDGEVVALLGSNGAGKTTLLRVISGLLKTRAGTVHFQGRDITNLAPDAIVELGIAHVPEGRQLFAEMTVEENLLLGSHIRRSRVRRRANLEKFYAMFPVLGERRKQMSGTLSGGEQQMLAISRALMSEPRLLLLDEPSLGLSPIVTEQMLAIVKSIAGPTLAVVIVEQKVIDGLEISSRGYVIEDGRLVTKGSAEELIRDPKIREAYLGL